MDNPFETNAHVYDQWYDDFPTIFQCELLALRALLPPPGKWIEIGVGTGRFAAELGIRLGIEPTEGMAVLARERGVSVIRGTAEAVPLESASVDAVFFITALCFVQDVQASFAEAFRILRPGGHCVIGLLPLDSLLGQVTRAHAADNGFFKHARLLTKAEVFHALNVAGFTLQQTSQTLLGPVERFEQCIPSQEKGHDRGSFVVLRAKKST